MQVAHTIHLVGTSESQLSGCRLGIVEDMLSMNGHKNNPPDKVENKMFYKK